ncbi:MAG: phosphorylase family protein [Phycisphaerales bacterium]
MRRIGIIKAMRAEAAPLIERLGLLPVATPWDDRLPPRLFGGASHGLQVDLVWLGRDERHGVDLIGTSAATLAATLLLTHRPVDLIVSAGTAGGFIARGGSIGTVYLSRSPICFLDRRVPIDGFRESALGEHPCVDASGLADALGLETGVVSTGDSLDATPPDLERMHRLGTHAKEMEAGAVAWVASLLGVPMLAVKAITDLVDGPHPTEAEFLEHLHTASDHLAEAIERLVEHLGSSGGDAGGLYTVQPIRPGSAPGPG